MLVVTVHPLGMADGGGEQAEAGSAGVLAVVPSVPDAGSVEALDNGHLVVRTGEAHDEARSVAPGSVAVVEHRGEDPLEVSVLVRGYDGTRCLAAFHPDPVPSDPGFEVHPGPVELEPGASTRLHMRLDVPGGTEGACDVHVLQS